MFRLIKLVVLGLLGYAIYEFFRGLSGVQTSPSNHRQNTRSGRAGNQPAPHLGSGNQQFSGPGEGKRVETEETTGTSSPHFVGRGVVHR